MGACVVVFRVFGIRRPLPTPGQGGFRRKWNEHSRQQ